MLINDPAEFARALSFGPYAWPGGDDIAYRVSDGACFCHACASAEATLITDSIVCHSSDGWRVVAVESTDGWECGDKCAHCGKHLGPELDGGEDA
jgi:hypothetical protein